MDVTKMESRDEDLGCKGLRKWGSGFRDGGVRVEGLNLWTQGMRIEGLNLRS